MTIQGAYAAAMKEWEKENPGKIFADGCEFATVLENGVLIVRRQGDALDMEFFIGKPLKLDIAVDVLESFS